MCQVSYFKSNEVRLLFPFEEIAKNHVLSFGNMDVDDDYESEPFASTFSAFEGDFEQTIVLLGMDVDEVEIKVQQSLEEVI